MLDYILMAPIVKGTVIYYKLTTTSLKLWVDIEVNEQASEKMVTVTSV